MTETLDTTHTPITLPTLLRLAGPVVMSRLGIMMMGLVDTICVGRYSGTQLGYHALGWAPTMVLLTTSIGLLSGIQVLTSQAIGEGRLAETGAVLRRGIAYAIFIGIAAGLLLIALGPYLLHHVGLTDDLADGASPVLVVFALSLLPIIVGDAGIFWLEAHGRPVPGALCMWGANIVNLVLNLWLVPGHSPFPVAGAVASAWATFASRMAFMVLVAIVVMQWRQARALGVFDPTPRDRGASRLLRRIGYAASVSYFVETAAFGSMTVVAGWIGVASVAAWAIVLNAAAFIFMLPLGLAVATGVLVGRAYGAGDRAGVRRAGLLGFGATTVAMLLICAAVVVLGPDIAAAYTRDPAVRSVAAAALLLSCLFYLPDGLQVVGAQALRAQSDIWVPTATHIFSYLIVMIPLCYLFAIPMGLGVNGIVWGVAAASAVSALLLIGRFGWKVRR